MRFIFALIVFASHLAFMAGSERQTLQWVYHSIFAEGYVGVSFFFVLSGFILSLNYQQVFLDKTKSYKSFYLARFARIYPLHLLTFVLAIPLTLDLLLNDTESWLIYAVLNISLVQSFFPDTSIHFSFNSLSWSISNEVFFYLLFPFLIEPITWFFKRYSWVTLCIFSLPITLAFILPKEAQHWAFYINPTIRLFDFTLGIILYNIYRQLEYKNIKKRLTILELSSIALILLFFGFHTYVPQVARYSFYYWIPISFVILIFSFQGGKISQLLSWQSLVYLGKISYGIYMFHQLVIRYLSIVYIRYFDIGNSVSLIILALVVTVVLSHLSYKYLETPLNKWLKVRAFKKQA